MLADTPAPPDSPVKDTTSAGFRQDVLQESLRQPVLVDFWAPWCGPCKQLAPVLEKAVRAADGKVKLVKMNIDEHPQIAGQLGIQSIPAVIAFTKGQPVDGFMGALPEGQIKGFIERLIGPLGPTAAEDLLKDADERVAAGDAVGASELYAAVLAQEPENAAAIAALAKFISILAISTAQSAFWRWRPRSRRTTPPSPPRAPRSSWPSRPPRSAMRRISNGGSRPTRSTTKLASISRWRSNARGRRDEAARSAP